MTAEETPKSVSETIEEAYKRLTFTNTSGNSHYASSGPEDLARRNASINEFLGSDDIEEPSLSPTLHDKTVVDEAIEQYESMLEILIAQPNRSDDDEILIDKLINKTGELFRYEELSLAMGAAAVEDFTSHRRIASELSLEIMGGINQGAFGALLNELLDDAQSSDSTYGKELSSLLERQPAPEKVQDSIELEDSTREIIGHDLKVLFPGLVEMLNDPDEGPLTSEQAVPLFEQLQQIANLDDDWTVELNDGKAAETSGVQKKVSIGRNRLKFPNRRAAIAVGFHESVVHGGRSEGISLPGSLDFEEGLATRLQQIISGEKRTPGVQYYLSIGLQAGADRGGEPRSYRETFEILWRREALLKEQAGKEVDLDAVRVQAQRQVHRTRRGGAIDTRDAAYFIGAQKAASWLNEIAELPAAQRRQQLALALTHRYDPTNPEHAAYIERKT